MGRREVTLDRYVNFRDNTWIISEILKGLGVECARKIEEKVDLQFEAIKKLSRFVNSELLMKLVIANSIVSYQLSAKGEEWWNEFAEYFSGRELRDETKILEEYRKFLPNSRTNRRLVDVKLRRIEKIKGVLERLSLDDLREFYMKNMNGLRELIADSLGSNLNSKTIVFMVKMFGYSGRIAFGKFVPFPMNIPIPLDSRIKRYTSMITNTEPTKFWNIVSEKSGIPPLHIDSILWPVLGESEEVMKRIRRVCRPEELERINRLIALQRGKPF